ncbi:MAG: hypothetical protein WDN28_05985 [Chthoniobacter sp.]
MSDFSDKFLREGKKLFSPLPGPFVYFGVFGKHPGWDDHMEDIGLDTESLLLARKIPLRGRDRRPDHLGRMGKTG